MRISEVELACLDGRVRLTATVHRERGGLGQDRLYVEYEGISPEAVGPPGDPFLLGMLLPAMATGEDMKVEAPVSPHLLQQMSDAISNLRGWHPEWRPIGVEATGTSEPVVLRPPGVASFFSGGVDSFYTVLSPHPDPITSLVTIVGLDLRFEKREAWPRVRPHLSAAAEELGLRHVVVDTNLYEVGHKYLFRAEHHGTVLSGVALGLAGMIGRCYIPTSSPTVAPRPWGTINLALPEWSGPQLELVNHGGETHRRDKLAAVAASDVALRHLRVCLRGPQRYNCGRCDKCVLTATRLQAAGVIDRCATLPRVSPSLVRRTRVAHGWLQECRDVRDDTAEPVMRRAVTYALWRARLIHAARPLVDVIRRRRLGRRLREHLPAG